MAKYAEGDRVPSSRHGEGTIVGVRQEMRTPPDYDEGRLRHEMYSLRGRIAAIEAQLARGKAPREESVYRVQFPNGRAMDVEEVDIDIVRSRSS